MRKIVLHLHTSLDGYAGGINGEMNWIKVDDSMFDYTNKLIDQADTAFYGRVTYDMMQGYWPTAADKPNASKHDKDHSAWYNKVNKLVISKTLQSSPGKNLTVISEDIPATIRKIKEGPGRNIQIFGSPSLGRLLMQHNLIDEYWFFVNPIILGDGIPVFPKGISTIQLKQGESKRFSSGVEALQFLA